MEGQLFARGYWSPESTFVIYHTQKKGTHQFTATIHHNSGLTHNCIERLISQMKGQLQRMAIAFHPAPYCLRIRVRSLLSSPPQLSLPQTVGLVSEVYYEQRRGMAS
jgi:hypothetical protein